MISTPELSTHVLTYHVLSLEDIVMHFPIQFSIETIDGHRLGKLFIPHTQIAEWLNFLVAPQYQADIVAAEQRKGGVEIYFEASEGLYLYLEMRVNCDRPVALAS